MKVSDVELKSVIQLPGPKRYVHFVKRVADAEVAWGLWNDGWALAIDDQGQHVFPLWSAREYAEACVEGDWAGYEPEEIELEALMGDLLPKLKERGMGVAVFPTPTEKGVCPGVDALLTDMSQELEKY